ncbi:MAG TPA: hypothetical protein VL360_05575 [Gammaproteobacteria bacterium]|jgi:hypothetical protein|nr:hypothetical protein [Gammaproteobacteria bacterium]
MKFILTSLSLASLISQFLTGVIAYYLLIWDNYFKCSIANIIHYAHNLPLHKHLVLLGMLPIYIAIVIFGSALLSTFVGSRMKDFIIRYIQPHKSKISF